MLPALPVLLTVVVSAATSLEPPVDPSIESSSRPSSEAPLSKAVPLKTELHDLRHDFWVDGAVTATATGGWLLSEFAFKRQLAPALCRWCDRRGEIDTLNGFDAWGRQARWVDPTPAGRASDVTGMALVPLTVLGTEAFLAFRQDAASALPTDLLLILESAALASVFNQTVKFMVGRERPFVHARALTGASQPPDPDDNVSFFSGHASWAFVMTVAAGTVAELRGYEGRGWIWALGLPLSLATGYLRMAADKHYLSDVLIGALSGSLFGVLVPLVIHGRTGHEATSQGDFEARLTATPGGLALVGTF